MIDIITAISFQFNVNVQKGANTRINFLKVHSILDDQGCNFFLMPEMEGANQNDPCDIQILAALEKIVFNLNNENLELSVQQTMNLFYANFPCSFNLVICMLFHAAFASQRGGFDIYLSYLKSIQTKEEELNIDNPKIIDILVNSSLRVRLKNHIIFSKR